MYNARSDAASSPAPEVLAYQIPRAQSICVGPIVAGTASGVDVAARVGEAILAQDPSGSFRCQTRHGV